MPRRRFRNARFFNARFATVVVATIALALAGVSTLVVSSAQAASPAPGAPSPTVSASAPTITSPTYSNESTQVITGTADPATAVTVEAYLIESVIGTCTATANSAGNWSCTISGFHTGLYSLLARSGSSFSEYLGLTVLIPPTINGIHTVGGVPTFFDSTTTYVPNVTGPVFTGKNGDPGSFIYMYITYDGFNSVTCTAFAQPDGTWTCDMTTSENAPMPGMFTEGRSYEAGIEEYSSSVNACYPGPTCGQYSIFNYVPRTTWFTGPVNTRSRFGTHSTTSLRPTVKGHSLIPSVPITVVYASSASKFGLNANVSPYCATTANSHGDWSCAPSFNLTVGHSYVLGPFSPDNSCEGPCNLPIAQLKLSVAAQPVAATIVPPVPTPTAFNWNLVITDDSGNDITGQPITEGQHVTLSGTGIPAGTTATAELHSTPVLLGSQVVGSNGTFSIPATVPADIGAGTHTFVVTLTQGAASQGSKEVIVPIVAPTVSAPAPAPSATPTPGPSSTGNGTGGPLGASAPGWLGTGLLTVQQFHLGPLSTVLTVGLALSLLILVAFPAELLESTVRANYTTMFGWLAPVRRRMDQVQARVKALAIPQWLSTFLMILSTSIILGYSSPTFGFNPVSLRMLLALFISLFVVNVGVSAIVMRFAKQRYGLDSILRPLPAAMLLAVASVAISRFAHIQPGFLFGVVISVTFAVELSKKVDGQIALLTVGSTIILGVLAWLGFSLLMANAPAEPSYWFELLRDSLVGITIESLATLVIALLPLEFVDGKVIFNWSRWAWAASYFVAASAFFLIVLPISDSWGSSSAPVLGWSFFFLIFAAFAIGVWAYFRFRKTPETEEHE